VTGGTTTRGSDKDPGQAAWEVKWQSADLNFVTEKDFSGKMHGISGQIYEQGQSVGSFTADNAQAYKESDRLTLWGHVRLRAEKPQSVLTCDQLEWDAAQGVVKAKVNVYVDTLDYRVGPFQEYWATPDFTVSGTPRLFLRSPIARSKMRHDATGL
jgi:hypothetical protein